MAHYDLYASLGVSRGNSCEQLSQEITRRLQTGQTTNPGGPDELRVALAVLGSPGRRAQYDAVLDNPNAAQLTPADITALANMPEHPAPQGYQAGLQGYPAAPQGYQATSQNYRAGQSTAAGAQTRRTSKTKLILAAVIAVVVLVAAVLGFFLLRDGSDDKSASAAETTTTSSDGGSADKSSESSSKNSSANKSGKSSSTSSSASSSKRTSARSSDPREMLDEFMALDSRDDRARWIEKHTDFDLVLLVNQKEDITHGLSTGEWTSLEADMYSEDHASDPPTIDNTRFLSDGDFSSDNEKEIEEIFGSDVTDIYDAEFNDSSGVIFVKSGGSWHYLFYYPG